MVKRTVALLLIVLLLAACDSAGNGCNIQGQSDAATIATLAARCAQDAGATYDAAQRATQAVVQSTAVAAQNATGTVVAAASQTAVAETSTAESLSVQSTSIALAALEVANAQTAAAADFALSAEKTRVWQETLNVEMARADQQRRLDNMRAREKMWNNIIYPALVAVITAVIIGLIVFGAIYLWRQKQPVIHVTINGRDVPMVLDGNSGGYKLLPRHLMGDVLQLPEPRVTAVPPEPLPALPEGHVLIAGPTRSGKSTAMRALLQHRSDIVVLDPHAAPGDWGSAQVKGAGRNFGEIASFMEWMMTELQRRAEARAGGTTVFPEMTVATDEMPSIAAELGRDTYGIWQKWVREGWKYSLYFVVSTQSTRVKSMGIEGESDVLQNFVAAILLGGEAVSSYPDLVAGMERPAVIRTLQGARPVVIPLTRPSSSTPSEREYVAPSTINFRSQAEADGRILDGVVPSCYSLNDVGRVLMEVGPEDTETRPSGQMLRERVRPALAWRINYLSCPDSSRILIGR